MNTKDKGDLAEAAILKDLLPENLVADPFGDNARYDFLVDTGQKIVRVQVKSARDKDGVISVHTSSSPTMRGNDREFREYNGEADIIAGYCPTNDVCFYVPVSEAGKREFKVRYQKTKNGQKKGINWLEDYKNFGEVVQSG
jgi:hypothetical protein